MKITVKTTALYLALATATPLLSSCMPHQQAGGTAGAYMGGIAGAILDSRNPWRGGVVGAALGALAGATIADVSVQGAREAAKAQRPVHYRTDDSRAVYYADPEGYDDSRRCRRVREKVYVDGELVKRRTVVICDQGTYDRPRYRYEKRYDRYESDDD
jgi:outer membrane lipoprotein SlyB